MSSNLLFESLIIFALTYFVCGIPFGLVVASAKKGIDVRTKGSGNIGSTNVCRSAGVGAGALTLLLDAGKGYVCIMGTKLYLKASLSLGFEQLGPQGKYFFLVSCVFLVAILGHVFSPYLKFHGGKGIATGFGCAIAAVPLGALGILAVFLVVVLVSRYVSLGSICAAISLPIWVGCIYGVDFKVLGIYLIISGIVIWAHRSNISRLIHGSESKFTLSR